MPKHAVGMSESRRAAANLSRTESQRCCALWWVCRRRLDLKFAVKLQWVSRWSLMLILMLCKLCKHALSLNVSSLLIWTHKRVRFDTVSVCISCSGWWMLNWWNASSCGHMTSTCTWAGGTHSGWCQVLPVKFPPRYALHTSLIKYRRKTERCSADCKFCIKEVWRITRCTDSEDWLL